IASEARWTQAHSERLDQLRSLLAQHKGECTVKLLFVRPNHSETTVSLPDDVKVAPSEALCNKVEQLFGEPVMTFR
ncbi:MAG TPA: hypothetical protein PLP17_08145, partial [Oligoflexia bacterium]|nr:hypothetical protein [Oligoflexia bacterium]